MTRRQVQSPPGDASGGDRRGALRVRDLIRRYTGRRPSPTLKAWAAQLLEEFERQESRSIHDYTTFARRYLGPLATRRVKKITAEEVGAWLRWLERFSDPRTGRRLGRATRRKQLYILSAFLERAIDRGILDENPVKELRPGQRPKKPKKARAKRAQESLELETYRGMILSPSIPPLRRFAWALFLLTGIRRGEFIGLEVGDFAPSSGGRLGVLTIERQFSTKRQRLDVTKTDEVRGVPVHPALEAFIRWRLETYGGEDPRAPLAPFFHSRHVAPHMKRWNGRTILKAYKDDLERLGAIRGRLHGTRHSMITIAVAHGAESRSIEAVTHCADPQTAYEAYLHFSWEGLSRAVRCLPITADEVRKSLGGRCCGRP